MTRRTRRLLIGLLIALAAYSLLGFLVLPAIALHLVNNRLEQYVNGPARLERLEFNPFSLQTHLYGLRLGEPEQLGFDRLYLDFEWRSLWQRRLYLADMDVEGLRGEALFGSDGQFNLQQLFEQEQPVEPDPDGAASEPFPLFIERIALSRGYLRLHDARTSPPINLVYDSLDLELHDLGTGADDRADATLTATSPQGGTLRWQGQLSLAPLTSSGSLDVSGLELDLIWPYVGRATGLQPAGGSLAFSTRYQLEAADRLSLTLSETQASLGSLTLDAPGGSPLLRLAGATLSGASVDLAGRQVTLGQLSLQQPQVWVGRGSDGQLNWLRLLDEARPNDEADETAVTEPSDEPDAPWRLALPTGQLQGARLHLSDAAVSPTVELAVGPLDLTVSNFDTGADSPFGLSLRTGIGERGQLQASGELSIDPPRGRLDIQAQALDLRIVQSYLTPYVQVELRSGRLDTDLAVELQQAAPLAFRVTGSAQIEQLRTLDTDRERDLLRWQRLSVGALDYRHGEALEIGRIELEQPYVRAIINPDQSTNFNDLLVKRAPEPQARPTLSTPKEQAQPLELRVGEIVLREGSGDFADLSLRPVFATRVEQLAGRIGTIDNRNASPAPVDITGRVDRYAPMSIKGRLTPFDPLQQLDITTRFEHVEMTTLSPYSSKFAGYRIDRGRLNLDLHYQIRNGELDAQNKVVIEQLQLGEKVDSPDAVDLPLRLAVALLKDSSGTISLQLPVRGDLNNPSFDVMPVVWQTLRNLMARAVKAPFRLLGSLVSGDERDLSEVPFPAGSADLTDEAQERLAALVNALRERPALRLEVEGRSLAQVDGQSVAEQRLERAYQDLWASMLEQRGEPVPADVSQLTVPEENKPALLEALYRTRLERQPPDEWNTLSEEARELELRRALMARWAGSAALLRRLAQARASRIKDHLVDVGGLDPQRVYLLAPSLAERVDGTQVTAVLHLGSL